jgi:peptidoglycan/xylan/chitin deacetylase (PgdA/CDA1 family)
VTLFAVVAVVVAGYWIVPDVLGHFAQLGALTGRLDEPRVALTFDDGPGPDTEAVLAVLGDLGVRATFFLVVAEAERRPEVVRALVAAGHEVGLHGWHHRSMWTMAPWTAAREIVGGRRRLEALTGVRVHHYRPPWGHHNLVTWILPGWVGLRRVLWTVAPDDWRPDKSPDAIRRHVLRYANPGAVVVLHDGGGDRSRTVAALGALVDGIRALGLEPVPVRDLAPERSWLRRGWMWWENLFTRLGEIDTVPASDGGRPLVRLGRARYPGPPLTLPDGSVIPTGAALAEIHFQNPTLGMDSRTPGGALRAYARMVGSLRDAARVIEEDPRFQDVQLVGGVTVLDVGEAVDRLGFRRVTAGGLRMLAMRFYLVFLMSVYHADGLRVWRRFRRLKPVYLYMTRDAFLARYARPRSETPDPPRSRA